jgi:elongation factor P--(R)-beta-lysine ligase
LRSASEQPGLAPPRPYSPTEAAALRPGTPVAVAGRVLAADGNIVILADASTTLRVWQAETATFTPGLWLAVHGVISERGVEAACVLSTSPGNYLGEGDFQRFSRVAKLLRARSIARRAVREYFADQDFLEVETPVRVRAPGTDVYLEPIPSGDHWLITSPEFQLKRLLVGGVPRVFEFARCFRHEELGLWHEPEFTLLEWYRSFEPYAAVMDDTERLVACVRAALDLPDSIRCAGHTLNLNPPFERVTTQHVFSRYAAVSDVAALAANDETRYFAAWVNEVEPALAALGRPVFVTEFPLSQAALARPIPGNPQFAERFELFAGPVELCNGYGELLCPKEQRTRFEHDLSVRAARQQPPLPIAERFLTALDEGLPPASGNALGFDRLMAVLLEQPLRDVQAFPAAEAER